MKITITAAVTALSLSVSAHAAPVDFFTGFAGFGDSLSDKGRNNGFASPSLDGRFSNGQTWMEIVGQQFEDRNQANVNLALGGATAGDANDNDATYSFVDSVTPRDPSNIDDINLFDLGTFNRQIGEFVDRGLDMTVGDNPLVGLLFGGNDFLQGGATLNPFEVAADVVAGVRRIAELDPKFDNFLVLNLPNLATTPLNAGATDMQKAQITMGVQAFNMGLSTGMDALANELGLTIDVFDLFTATNVLLSTTSLRLDTPCTTSISDPNQPFNLCPTVDAADAFYFVDGVHPSGPVHTALAAQVTPLISDRLAPIPLPASALLLGLGLAGLGVARRKAA